MPSDIRQPRPIQEQAYEALGGAIKMRQIIVYPRQLSFICRGPYRRGAFDVALIWQGVAGQLPLESM